jgi:hypothetical protein
MIWWPACYIVAAATLWWRHRLLNPSREGNYKNGSPDNCLWLAGRPKGSPLRQFPRAAGAVAGRNYCWSRAADSQEKAPMEPHGREDGDGANRQGPARRWTKLHGQATGSNSSGTFFGHRS